MALTLVSSWGASNANVYTEVATADDYITCYCVATPTAWNNLTTVQQTAAIYQATIDIDFYPWQGVKRYSDQRLSFPRQYKPVRFPWNYVVASTSTLTTDEQNEKLAVERACAEQAFWIARQKGKSKHEEKQRQGIRSYSETIGPISESYTYGYQRHRLCVEAMRLISQFLGTAQILRA